MTYLWRRRRRVATTPVAFIDSADSHADLFSDAGETFPSLAQAAPRPSYVHRSSPDPLSLVGLPVAFDLQAFPQRRRKALAAALPRAYPRTYPRVFAGKSVGKRWATHQRAEASLAEFNRLRADPRTSMCARRRERREVLFSLRVAGRRGSAPGRHRRYVRNVNSQWSC